MSKYHKRYSFRVEIDGIEKAAFRTCGPLEGTIGVVEENEGTQLPPTKEPGKVKYNNVTLTDGVTDNNEIYEWWKSLVDGNEDDKRDLAIVQTNRKGVEIKRWNIFNAFPARFKAGDWDATSEENSVEEIELAFDNFEKA